jgi:hypothetical protein
MVVAAAAKRRAFEATAIIPSRADGHLHERASSAGRAQRRTGRGIGGAGEGGGHMLQVLVERDPMGEMPLFVDAPWKSSRRLVLFRIRRQFSRSFDPDALSHLLRHF